MWSATLACESRRETNSGEVGGGSTSTRETSGGRVGSAGQGGHVNTGTETSLGRSGGGAFGGSTAADGTFGGAAGSWIDSEAGAQGGNGGATAEDPMVGGAGLGGQPQSGGMGGASTHLSTNGGSAQGGSTQGGSNPAGGGPSSGGTSGAGGASDAALYVDANQLDLRVKLGSSNLPNGVRLEFDVTGDQNAELSGEFAAKDPGPALRIYVENNHRFELEACRQVDFEPATGTLRIRVPRAYLRNAPNPGVRAEFGSTRLGWLKSKSVEVLPSFEGQPLECGKDWGTVIGSRRFKQYLGINSFATFSRGCGLDEKGEVACLRYISEPPEMPASGPFVEIGLNRENRLCGRRDSGTVDCWPLATSDGKFPRSFASPPNGKYRKLSEYGSCAIAEDASLRCFTESEEVSAFTAGAGTFVDVAGSASQGCAVRTTGELQCWGFSDTEFAPAPKVALLAGRYRQVAVANAVVCALNVDGGVDCVHGYRSSILSLAGNDFSSVSGFQAACAVEKSGNATCFGLTLPFPPLGFRTLVAGEVLTPSCGLLSGGQIGCWSATGGLSIP
ncbi:MAG TPA: hypothetical protein VFQ61_28605 [Polyangiaceae bacterium]|nr:hypothetical protein [Polyangiaceae bacterium]